MKKGDRVTTKAWYLRRRVYGRFLGKDSQKGFVVVTGDFGLGSFHVSNTRKIREKTK